MLAIHIEQDNMQTQHACWNLGSEALVKWLIKCFNVTAMPSIKFTFDLCSEQSHGMFVYSPHRSQLYCHAIFMLMHCIVHKLCRDINSSLGGCTVRDLYTTVLQGRKGCMMIVEGRMVMAGVCTEI